MDIELKRLQKRGPYVQFNISGDEQDYHFWADDSLFLYEPVFGVFVNNFKFNDVKFNYYGPTLYTESALEILEARLNGPRTRLNTITGSESLKFVHPREYHWAEFPG